MVLFEHKGVVLQIQNALLQQKLAAFGHIVGGGFDGGQVADGPLQDDKTVVCVDAPGIGLLAPAVEDFSGRMCINLAEKIIPESGK